MSRIVASEFSQVRVTPAVETPPQPAAVQLDAKDVALSALGKSIAFMDKPKDQAVLNTTDLQPASNTMDTASRNAKLAYSLFLQKHYMDIAAREKEKEEEKKPV